MNALYTGCAHYLDDPLPPIPFHHQLAGFHASIEAAKRSAEEKLLIQTEAKAASAARQKSIPEKVRQRLVEARIKVATYCRFSKIMARKRLTADDIARALGCCRANAVRHLTNLISAQFVACDGRIRRDRAFRWIG